MNKGERYNVMHPSQFFHGSDHEFEPGDEVVPGIEAGKKNFAQRSVDRQSSVYVSPVRRYAKTWGKHVYEVEPIGDVVADEHATFVGDSRTPRAKVIKRT